MATESIGELIPTAIPGYADAADIQAALRAYHYGSYSYSPANTSPSNLVSPSMAKTIYDIQKNKKIDVSYFIKTYLKKDELKILSTLNNKIVIQKDDEVYLFSLKNEEETFRFLDVIANKFRKENRGDCMFITDVSTPQRKYMLKILEEKGFDKKMLYKNVTTYPRSIA